jgi:hypothetical protein
MRPFIPALGLSSILFAAAMSGGCSSSSANPAQQGDAQAGDDVVTVGDAMPGDAQPGDAQTVEDAPTGADSGGPTDGGSVWSAGSTGFVLSESGGFVAPPPDGSPCTAPTKTWTYDVASRTITRTGCSTFGQPQDATAAAQLVALVTTLTAKGPSMTCGADFPDESITILGPGAAQRKYDSDFYSAPGCNVTTGTPLFVAFEDLGMVINAVDGFFDACKADGGATDAGATCVTGDR